MEAELTKRSWFLGMSGICTYGHLGAQTRWFLPRKRREVISVRKANFPHLKHDIMASARGVVMMEPGAFLT